jgi:SH3-like domain-containing protein
LFAACGLLLVAFVLPVECYIGSNPVRFWRSIPNILLLCVLALLLLSSACKRGMRGVHGDPAYVAAPQVNLRDRLSAVYNKTGTVKNGERVEILEKSKHFVRVRSPRDEEGWMEARYLVGSAVFDGFEKLAAENAAAPVQGHGTTRAELKMHVTPGRDTDALFRLEDGAKVELLKRASAIKPDLNLAPKNAAAKEPPPAPALEDWWLVRDPQRHTGWVLARMIDVDIPLDIAQYAEGQRIIGAFVINQVPDMDPKKGGSRQVPQYLTLVNEPKDGMPWDYNQIRVFTWNQKRHHYETAYRERKLFGVLPVTLGHEEFPKEGDLPTFTIRVKDEAGNITERKYKLNQPIVRRVLSPGDKQQLEQAKAARLARASQTRGLRHTSKANLRKAAP